MVEFFFAKKNGHLKKICYFLLLQNNQPQMIGPEQFSCPHCPKLMSKSDEMKRHIATHTVPIVLESSLEPPEPVKIGMANFECPYKCGFKKTRTQDEMRIHIREHTGDVIEPVRVDSNTFGCPFCAFLCKGRKQMYSHIRIHTGERPFKCPHCDFTSATKKSCQRHIQSQHPIMI